MADTLLFRGGSSASIAVSTVQNRELVIDTDTYQIVSGASKKKTVMEDSNGDVEIGGGNIELRAGGSIVAAADATINDVTVGRGGGSDASNSVVGQGALGNNTTGTNNTAIGRSALSTNTTGNFNTALGQNALFKNTEGGYNAAIGQDALRNNTTGTNNSAIGQGALQSNTTGGHNTAIGVNAGFYIEGSNNTILGAYKGTAADSTLSNTVIISAGATERARCNSSGDWDFGSLILKSPDGTSFRLSVANDGTLSASSI